MNVTVVGGGTMGHGIAQVAAMGHHEVTIRDVETDLVAAAIDNIESNLQKGVELEKVSADVMAATLERIQGTTDIQEAVLGADLVIEAVPEDMVLKKQVFEEIEGFASEETVIATNTSSMSVTELASVLDAPQRAVGTHFFKPPHLMDLVEVMVAEQTAEETVDFALNFVESISKEPIVVADSPGFATSRLGVYFGLEALRMVESGVARPDHIDKAMRLGFNHPMGPIELTDMVGLDIRINVAQNLREELGERFRPPQILKKKVRAGKLGRKTGEGFYLWEDGEKVGLADDWD